MNNNLKIKFKKFYKFLLALELLIFCFFPFARIFLADSKILSYLAFYFSIVFSTSIIIYTLFYNFDETELKSIYYLIMLFYIPIMFIIEGLFNLIIIKNYYFLSFYYKIAYISSSIFLIVFFLCFSVCGFISISSNKFLYLHNFLDNFYKKLDMIAKRRVEKSKKMKEEKNI